MKKEVIWIIAALVLVAFAKGDYTFYNIKPECQYGLCVEGDNINWTIEIENKGERKNYEAT